MDVVAMPQLGETVTEGTITRWSKAVGDRVEVDDALFEVSTEKVDTEVPAATAGWLREILVAEGDTVPIGTPVAILTATADEPFQQLSDEPVAAEQPAEAEQPDEPPTRFLSPAVKRLLDEHGLDPEQINGSGRGGRITRADVRAVAANPPGPRPVAPAAPAASPAAGEIIPFDRARLATARHLRESLDTAAHAVITMQVDYRNVERVRGEVGYLVFVARAVVDALGLHPRFNGTVDGDRFIRSDGVNLGFAVDLGDALVVPVLHGADRLRLPALAEAIAGLADRARRRRLDADAHRGGSFTITNMGALGTHSGAPIINGGQVAICSVDGITPTPVAVPTGDGHGLAVHPVGNLSLSFDHRAVDGAAAGRFLAEVRTILQTRDWEDEVT